MAIGTTYCNPVLLSPQQLDTCEEEIEVPLQKRMKEPFVTEIAPSQEQKGSKVAYFTTLLYERVIRSLPLTNPQLFTYAEKQFYEATACVTLPALFSRSIVIRPAVAVDALALDQLNEGFLREVRSEIYRHGYHTQEAPIFLKDGSQEKICNDLRIVVAHKVGRPLQLLGVIFYRVTQCSQEIRLARPDVTHIESLVKNSGVGTLLLAHTICFYKAQNYASLSLSSRKAAVGFYLKCGFLPKYLGSSDRDPALHVTISQWDALPEDEQIERAKSDGLLQFDLSSARSWKKLQGKLYASLQSLSSDVAKL